MSLRRKFTIPERQLEACWEPVGFMQTERGAASEVCRRPASWWSCSLRVQARDEVLRGKIQGARPGVVMVLSQSAQTGVWSWCSARCVVMVLGHSTQPGAWSWCSATVLGWGAQPGAWSQCLDGMLGQVCGLSAWLQRSDAACGRKCSDMELGHTRWVWCLGVVLGLGAQVLGHTL